MYEIGTIFYYGVYTLCKSKIEKAIVEEKTSYGKLLVKTFETREVIGKYSRRELFRHIKLSELYVDSGFKLSRKVIEFEAASRVDVKSTEWWNKGQKYLDYYNDFIKSLPKKDQQEYVKRAQKKSAIKK